MAALSLLPDHHHHQHHDRITRKLSPFEIRTSPDELRARGKRLRDRFPRDAHGTWKARKNRPDPVDLIQQANQGRLPNLIPIRHGRMLPSAFTFFRGTALNMAADLARTPSTGLRVQACGDAHLGNFRCFATPERRLIFDINDFDETLPAPWEWDLKRLAASFVIACRNNGISDSSASDAACRCTRSYREHMAEFSRMNVLDVWYASYEAEAVMKKLNSTWYHRRLDSARERRAFEHDFPQLVSTTGSRPRIREHPPTIYHWPRGQVVAWVEDAYASYLNNLPAHRRLVLDRFELLDKAVKVVGVGSVGTVCFIMLLMASAQDPLFLQVKEARASVLEAYAGRSVLPNHGERVVVGHWLMQSASDMFLGWTSSRSGRHYYVRQLRDAKIKFQVERLDSAQMLEFADACGYTLARAHARSGDPATISGYLGKKSDEFDNAIAEFSIAYADQVERDYGAFKRAVQKGRLPSEVE